MQVEIKFSLSEIDHFIKTLEIIEYRFKGELSSTEEIKNDELLTDLKRIKRFLESE